MSNPQIVRSLFVTSCVLIAPSATAGDIVFRDNCEGPNSPLCGNHIVEAGEICDGNCPICGAESFTGYTSAGTDDTCDVQCHVPIQACVNGDAACPFIVADNGATCNSTNDAECAGPSWRYVALTTVNYSAACATVRVYGISAGGSYLATTCAPPATAVGTGDPVIDNVVDSFGRQYAVDNDDCVDPTALPNLAGWSCANSDGFTRMACASPNPAGFVIPAPAPAYLDVRVCPIAGGAAKLYIWYNAPAVPNPG